MKRIAIDMDEVIADFNCKFIASFNARFSENITVADLAGKTVEQFRPQLLAEMRAMICEDGFFRDMPVIPDSQRGLKHCITDTKYLLPVPRWTGRALLMLSITGSGIISHLSALKTWCFVATKALFMLTI